VGSIDTISGFGFYKIRHYAKIYSKKYRKNCISKSVFHRSFNMKTTKENNPAQNRVLTRFITIPYKDKYLETARRPGITSAWMKGFKRLITGNKFK
jgi:hypothetical protein